MINYCIFFKYAVKAEVEEQCKLKNLSKILDIFLSFKKKTKKSGIVSHVIDKRKYKYYFKNEA